MQWYLQIYDISKIKRGVGFSMVAPKTGLFSISLFRYGWHRIFTNKNIFLKGGLNFYNIFLLNAR